MPTGDRTDRTTPPTTPPTTLPTDRRSREVGPVALSPVVLGVALLAGLALLVGALVAARSVSERAQRDAGSRPVPVAPLPAPEATSGECAALLGGLPGDLGRAHRVAPADPAPDGVAAYRLDGDATVIVRCGLPAPSEFRVGTALTQVGQVQWFHPPSGSAESGPAGNSTWVAVDRARYVAATMPDSAGTGVIQDLSTAVAAAMPATAIRPAPAR